MAGTRKRRTRAQLEAARKRAASARKHRLKVKHRMSVEQYDAILAVQGGVCALCQRPGVSKFLAVDHDHKVAREVCDHVPAESCPRCWRGLVHGWENTVLGRIGDSVEWLQRAIRYLRRPPAQVARRGGGW